MKTFITIIATAIVLISNSTFATTSRDAAEGKTARSKVAAINNTLDQYTAALAKGQVGGIEKLFTDQFQQRYNTGKNANNFNKAQVVGFLKEHKNIQQECQTSYSIVDENKGAAIAKVEMKYETGTRVDYVTVTRDRDGYKISQVITNWE